MTACSHFRKMARNFSKASAVPCKGRSADERDPREELSKIVIDPRSEGIADKLEFFLGNNDLEL